MIGNRQPNSSTTPSELDFIPELKLDQRELLDEVHFEYPAAYNLPMTLAGVPLIILAVKLTTFFIRKCGNKSCKRERAPATDNSRGREH